MELTGEIPPLDSLAHVDAAVSSPDHKKNGRAPRGSFASSEEMLEDLAEFRGDDSSCCDSGCDVSGVVPSEAKQSAELIEQEKGAVEPRADNVCATPPPITPVSTVPAEQLVSVSPEPVVLTDAAVATSEVIQADATSASSVQSNGISSQSPVASLVLVAPVAPFAHSRAAQLIKTLRAAREVREKRAALAAMADQKMEEQETTRKTGAAPDYAESERVNEYLRLDADSDEALALACAIFDATGYAVGPMRRGTGRPTMADKRACVKSLAGPLDIMDKESKREKKEFEKLTGAKVAKDEEGDYEYIDNASGNVILPEEYSKRFHECVVERDDKKKPAEEILWSKWGAALQEFCSSQQ